MNKQQVDAVIEGNYELVRHYDISLIDRNLLATCISNCFCVMSGIEDTCKNVYDLKLAQGWIYDYRQTIRYLSYNLEFIKKIHSLPNGVRCLSPIIFDYFWDDHDIYKGEDYAIAFILGSR
jgi:hypothetical protein